MSENEEKEEKACSESVIRKLLRGTFQIVLWIYALAVLILLGISIWFCFQNDFMIIGHLMTIAKVFSIAILGISILGILFKSLHKRVVVLPLLIFVGAFITQNLIGNILPVSSTKSKIASYNDAKKIFNTPQSADRVNQNDPLTNSGTKIVSADAIDIPMDNTQNTPKKSAKILIEESISNISLEGNTNTYEKVREYLNQNRLPPKSIIQVNEMINYFPYDYEGPNNTEEPFSVRATLIQSPWKKGKQLLHIALKGYEKPITEENCASTNKIQEDIIKIAEDVEIQVKFNPIKVEEYHLIGHKVQPNWENSNGDSINIGKIDQGQAVTILYELAPIDPKNKRTDIRQQTNNPSSTSNNSAETAFVRIGYKLPGEESKKSLERIVIGTTEIDKAPKDVCFGVAVAAFGQKLKDNNFTDWTWRDIKNFANLTIDKKRYKDRQEFVSLVKKTENLIKAEKFDPNY